MERMVRKKKIAKKYEGLTREQKKLVVMRDGGSEVMYFSCPLCGFNRPLNKYLSGDVKFINIDLDRFNVLVTRVGGGLGSGFFRVDEKSFLLREVKQMPEYRELLDQLKEQCTKILEVLKW